VFTCGPQFFGSRGDHPAGDGLTRLQTAFAGASAADISGFGVSHTQSGGTLGNGYYDVVIATGGGFNPGLSYNGNSLARQASGAVLTIEAFVSLQAYPTANNSSTQTHLYLNNITSSMTGGSNPIQMQTTGGFTATNFSQVGAVYANWSATGDKTPGLLGQMRHVAWVWYADNTYAEYYNGVRQAGPTADTSYLLGAPTPTILLGSPSASAFWTDFTMRYHGLRVRRAAMYSGASFTPPSSPAAWGPP